MDSEDFESETNSEAEEEFPPTNDEVMQSQVRKPLLEITTACMPLNEIALKGIQMKELGDIQLPVSLQDVTKLKGIAENGINGTMFTRAFDPSLTQAWEIDSSKLLTSLPEKLDLLSLVTDHLEFPTDKMMDIQAKLTKLILYEAGGRYERNLNNSAKEFGTFGTAILQLPVEGGYEGGILKVKCKGQSKLFDNHRSSDARFYLSAFYGSFEYFVEPITQGWQLTLVFDLLWTNTKMMKPYDASVSLVALREIENAANQWITLNKDNSPIANSKVSSAENQVEGAPDPLPLKIILDESDNDCIGNSLSSALKWKELARQQLSQDLHQIIEFWCTKPERLWVEDPDLENGELTLRLLRLCITLRTREGGLAILKAIGTDFDSINSKEVSEEASPHNSPKLFEGIQNEQVAEAIAEFSSQVTDFDDCADLIKRMISPNRLAKQFVPVIKLIKSFLYTDCIQGAIKIGDWVAASIAEVTKCMVAHLEESAVEAYIDSILTLETFSEDPSGEKIASFITFYSKLQISLQFHLVLHLEVHNTTARFRDIDSFQCTFQELCKTLHEDFHINAPSVQDIIVNLMSLYVKLKNSGWLHRLIFKIFPYGSNGILPGEHNDAVDKRKLLLKKLALSEEIWDLATSSRLGKIALSWFVGSYFKLLLAKLSIIAKKKQKQSLSSQVNPIDDALLCELSSCLQLILRMQSNPQLSDSWWTDEILEQLVLLDIDQLWYLLNDIEQSKSKVSNNHPCCVKIRSHLCTSLVDRMKEKTNLMPRRETILNVVMHFIKFCDESLVKSLVSSICNRVVTAPWGQHFKYELFNNLLNSSDVRPNLSGPSICQILNSCTDLVVTWISQIGRTLDSKSISLLNECEERICECVQLFVLVETERYDTPQKKNVRMVRAFRLLSEKLPPSTLLRMLDCVYNPTMNDKTTTNQSFESIPVCLEWCRDVCSILFSTDVLSLSSLASDASKIVDWLFWLGDDRSWLSFTNKICASPCSEKIRHFVRVFLLDAQIQEAIAETPPAFTAFIRIADHWANKCKSIEVPDFTWQMPKAIVPDYPEVECFLRSPEKTLRYTNLTDSRQVNILAANLEENSAFMGFSVSVTLDETYSSCEIVKTREYYTRVTRDFTAMKLESDELIKLRLKISQMRAKKLKAKRSAPIEVSSTFVPPAKRRNLYTFDSP